MIFHAEKGEFYTVPPLFLAQYPWKDQKLSYLLAFESP